MDGLIHRTIDFIPVLKEFVWSGAIVYMALRLAINISDCFGLKGINEGLFAPLKEIWPTFYSKNVIPNGKWLVKNMPLKIPDSASYYLGGSLTGVIFAMSLYILSAGLLLVAAYASYYVFGYVPNLSSAIELLAALSVTLGIAIIVESEKVSNSYD